MSDELDDPHGRDAYGSIIRAGICVAMFVAAGVIEYASGDFVPAAFSMAFFFVSATVLDQRSLAWLPNIPALVLLLWFERARETLNPLETLELYFAVPALLVIGALTGLFVGVWSYFVPW